MDHVEDVAIAMKEAVQKQKGSSFTNFNVVRVIMIITDNLLDAGVKGRYCMFNPLNPLLSYLGLGPWAYC